MKMQTSDEVRHIQKKFKGKKRLKAMMDLCSARPKKCRGNDEAQESQVSMKDSKGRRLSSLQGAGCNAPQPKHKKNGLSILREFSADDDVQGVSDRKQELSPRAAFNLFKNISAENAVLLGFNPRCTRPEWLIWTVLPVPPPHVRPSVAFDSATRAQDDLTHVYANIVKTNNALANANR